MRIAMDAAARHAELLPLHRSEALTDGIFAVAMTLLVIELKLPEHALIHSGNELAAALANLIPKALSWALSFFILALFWIGHHRAFASVRRADARLVTLNLLQLAPVSLMPFSSALSGEYGGDLLAQIVFSTNMAWLGVMALLVLRYIHGHPQLSDAPMSGALYRGARFRLGGIILISVIAVLIGAVIRVPALGNMAFALMLVTSPLSRAIERRELSRAAQASGAADDSSGVDRHA